MKKNQSTTKSSSRVSHTSMVVAAPPPLSTSVVPDQPPSISKNQPSREFAVHSVVTPESSNNSPRPAQLRCTPELAPATSNDHSCSREPTIDDLTQLTHSTSSELTDHQLAAPESGHPLPRPATRRSAAEQAPAAITDQPGFREPTQDDRNQPPHVQFPENTLAAATETSSRIEWSLEVAGASSGVQRSCAGRVRAGAIRVVGYSTRPRGAQSKRGCFCRFCRFRP